ncbi:unnamed protein product [Calypogeia fissa]
MERTERAELFLAGGIDPEEADLAQSSIVDRKMRKRARDCVDFVASAGILFGNCGSRTVAELLLLAESWTSYGRRRGSNSEKWRRPAEQQYDAARTSILGVPSPRLHCVSLVLLDLEIYARLYVRKLWREFTK